MTSRDLVAGVGHPFPAKPKEGDTEAAVERLSAIEREMGAEKREPCRRRSRRLSGMVH
jgi:hypothetical protein